MKKLLSVIVPVYNVEQYLKQCVESILNSTYSELEVLLIDDGSSDSSYEICQKYASIDTRVICYHFNMSGGAVRARQKGLELATAEYVTYVDSDDWIEADAFEKMMNALTMSHADMAISTGRFHEYGEYVEVKQDNIKAGIYSGRKIDDLCRYMLNDSALWATLWNKVFLKDKHTAYQMKVNQNIRVNNDAACTIMNMLNVDDVVVINETLYHYRKNNTSLANTYKTQNIESHCWLYQGIYEEVVKNDKLMLLNDLKLYFIKKLFMDIRIEYSRMNSNSILKKIKRINSLYTNPIIINFLNENDVILLEGREAVMWELFRKKKVVKLYFYLKIYALYSMISEQLSK